jgi:hypothetical protein
LAWNNFGFFLVETAGMTPLIRINFMWQCILFLIWEQIGNATF